MGLNEVGCVAHACWASIPEHVEGVHLDAFVVMPNHVHGLIGLAPARDPVAPLHATTPKNAAMSTISPTAGSLSAIVRSYKSAVTRAVRPARPAFAWQARFHDHVVRSAEAFHRIRAYVEANPTAWERDRFYPDSASRR